MKRPERTERLRMALQARKAYTNGALSPRQAFDWLIAALLENQDRRVLHFVIDNEHAASSDVAEAFKISQQQAATVLLRLYRLDMLSREERRNGSGRYYLYQDKDRRKR